MSDVSYPVMTQPQVTEAQEYERAVIEMLSEVQSDFLAVKSFSRQLVGEVKQVKTLAQELFSKEKGSEKEKKFSGSLTYQKVKEADPGSAFMHQTLWNIQDENEKKSSGLWKLLGGGLLGGGLIAGAIGVLLSGLFDEGPFKGVKKLVGKLMLELGQGIMKKVIKPFKGLIDNIFKTFGDSILKPFKSFTGKIWAKLKGIADVLLKPFKSVFDNIIKWFGNLGGKLFKGLGKGPIGKAMSKVAKFVSSKMVKLAKVLKFAPGIGSIIGLGFSISRFINGDIAGGLLELVGAIADAVPGIGTAISWGIDILLAARDLGAFKEGGVIKGKLDVGGFFGKIWNWVKEKALALGSILAETQPIKFVVDFAKKLGEGDIEGALESLAFLSAPVGWLLSMITGTPKGEQVKKQTAQALRSSGSVIKKVAGKVAELSSALFDFIGETITGIIQRAGNVISVGTEWVNDKILSPVMSWVGDKIGAAIRTAKNVAEWVDENIINPIGGFFKDIYTNVKRGWNAAVGPDGWIQTKLINPVFNFFDRMWTAITEAKDNIVVWVREKLIWPLRDFFSSIGSFFSAFKGKGFMEIVKMLAGQASGKDTIQTSIEEQQRSKVRDIASANLDLFGSRQIMNQMELEDILRTLKKEGIYAPGVSDVQDAIIKPGGQVIRTAPDDTIIATKNDVNRQSDKEINATIDQMNGYDDRNIQKQNAAMINLLEKIANKNYEKNETNVVQTKEERIGPRQITRMMTAEAY